MAGNSEFDHIFGMNQEEIDNSLWALIDIDNDNGSFRTSSVKGEKDGTSVKATTNQQLPVESGHNGNTPYTLQAQPNYINQHGQAPYEGNCSYNLAYPEMPEFFNSVPPVTSEQPPKNILASTGDGGDMVVSSHQPILAERNPVVVTHDEEQNHVSISEGMAVMPQQPQLLVQQQQQVGLHSQLQNAFQAVYIPASLQQSPPIQQSTTIAIAPQQQPHPTPISQKTAGVVDLPALTDMEGVYGFTVCIEEKERTTKSPMWLMSNITKKLYTNINKAVPFEIRLKEKVPADFRIRAVVVFSSAQFLRTNVTRCPNHASSADVTNHDFPYPAHVLRADHPEAKYEENPNGRLSVIVPLDILQDGSDYTPVLLRFMCLGSCVGGINRRPIAIILTLENNLGHLYGRKVIDVRVCACPTRDIRTDEQTQMNKGVKRRGTSLQEKTQLIRKKPKSATTVLEPKNEPPEEEIYYIPVRGRQLYNFMMDMKESYLRNHPEYAAKYPDDLRFQNEDDSEDELKGNTLPRIGVGDSETANWDSGGDSPQRIMFNESHLDTLNENKNNSPLSKLTPNISISPAPAKLRLWHDDAENEVIGFTRGESLEYTPITKAQTSDLIQSSKTTNSTSINTESITSNSPVVPGQFIKNIKHIPVMQVSSYKPGGSALKTKSVPVLKCTLRNLYGDERSNISSEKKNTRGNIQYSPVDSSEINIGEEYFSPGSPEMLAANVLVEGFKAKMITKQ